MNALTIPASAMTMADGEPRIRDLALAESLGFAKPHTIRDLIVRNRTELEAHGSFPCRAENPGAKGGRPASAYYLNEGQALVICALSRTEKAAEVRKQLIDVFRAYRAGFLQPADHKPVPVVAHRRRLPTRILAKADVSFVSVRSDDIRTADVTLRMPFATAIALLKAIAPV